MSVLAEAGWREGVFELPEWPLENGEVIAPFRLSYATLGEARDDGRNAVLMLPGASGVRTWAMAHAGSGSTIDPDEHFIISVDAIGGGESSRPSLGLGSRFPAYSIRDNARAIHRLLSEGLGLRQIKAAGGPSMGAMIALEMGLCFPGFASGLFLWSPSSRGGTMFPILTQLIEAIFRLSPTFEQGGGGEECRDALFTAGLAYFPVLVGRGFLEKYSPDERTRLSRLAGESFAANWNAQDLLSRYRSLSTHDVRRRVEGIDNTILSQLDARCLLMPCESDLLLPFEDALDMRAQISGALWHPIESDAGHWSASQPTGSSEHRQVQTETRAFLTIL